MNGTPITARVAGVRDDIVTIRLMKDDEGEFFALVKNEVVYICPGRLPADGRQERLQAEVLRVRHGEADVQVFENTRGVSIGDVVVQSSRLLSVALGPGLLGQIYDGLQNPLELIAGQHGFFLPRGLDVDGIDQQQHWAFQPLVKIGSRVKAGDVLGKVQERRFNHKIMVPFNMRGEAEVTWVQEGSFTVTTPVVRLRDQQGQEHEVCMQQFWPVRVPVNRDLLRAGYSERMYPHEPMLTTIRLIDTFFPVAKGGTACIPGPFGAGKTVLQSLISRYSDVDIVIIVACGERAGEVVETITEFPKTPDPKGGTLMDRTVIICNTSSMPVAAREASIYTGITISEYYRQMGYNVLLIADSTSRWAQAMRETSGRLEEIPGEEAFPAYLDSAVRALYERAGLIRTNDGSMGSLTLIGTVSPAGGNFEEPVTQSTLRTVKTFLGLSAERAYKRAYPAVDPLISWSRYLEQLEAWFAEHMDKDWVPQVREMLLLLRKGEEVQQMMQVTGEEGVTLEDYMLWQKSQCLDQVYLQQDAFDAVDISVPIARQRDLFRLLTRSLENLPALTTKEAVRKHFVHLTSLFRNLNYTRQDSPEYQRYWQEIEALGAPSH
ncbi:V-type ATP synthase subunit A [Nitrincola iocasae]|jgi:V/A-type H+-transporting ATPase subunit A|uniref:V-type ATP synthase alpha chain n=1 Tax=Nitrincola iocasae TaxID=2614693 RepID=A0A5J6LHT2_9GAMM|nr:V-type ATP synthase subunit A [Nitrincola iocasae]QEW07872.1 V-type ATP synthase subunit A [Nitrincola iocasae]